MVQSYKLCQYGNKKSRVGFPIRPLKRTCKSGDGKRLPGGGIGLAGESELDLARVAILARSKVEAGLQVRIGERDGRLGAARNRHKSKGRLLGGVENVVPGHEEIVMLGPSTKLTLSPNGAIKVFFPRLSLAD